MKMELFYNSPANKWEQSLPIGNGSLGAMITRDVNREKLGLNQDSIWSGYQHDKNNQSASQYLERACELIFAGKYAEAEEFIEAHMLGEYNENYLPLGELTCDFSHRKEVTNYRRELNLENSIVKVSYQCDGHSYMREYFASYPANAILVKFTCSEKVMDTEISFTSLLQVSSTYTEKGIIVSGKCPEHVDPNYVNQSNSIIQGTRGMEVNAEVNVLDTDGSVSIEEGALKIDKASVIILAIGAMKPMKLQNDYESMKKAHIEDYRNIYGRVELYLGDQKNLPTNERLLRLRNGEKDLGLYALYFQYGRYLLISSSREGSMPANLQGIWSWEMRPAWSSNWTTNINVEMNYWPAQSCNLKECLPPYFELLKRLCEEGKKTAKVHYNCRGFVHHHNADFWCNTNPVGVPHGQDKGEKISTMWSFFPMGGAWMCSELWKNYEYNQDKEFLLKTAYPILKEAALFLVDWVVEHEGKYVTCPSTSPENRFRLPDGRTSSVAISSAMDLAMIREVFSHFEKTCMELEIEDEILPIIKERLAKLDVFKVGSKGQLLEWNEEFEETDLGHRHISHLYGLFPSELFEGNEELTEACRKGLMIRMENGGGPTGWSCAWIINMLAILGEGEKAYQYLHTLLTRSTHDNLWGDHPPFQIDANFGGIAGIANMLVQDRNGSVKVLPALPKEFKNGYVKGLRIKSGKTIDIYWENNQLKDYRIY